MFYHHCEYNTWFSLSLSLVFIRITPSFFSVKMKQKKYIFQLTKAITNLEETAVTKMINSGADVDATIIYSKTPLSYALEMGSENIALLLLKSGANPEKAAICEKSCHTLKPIHFASQFNRKDFLSMLLKKNVDLEAKSSAGLCALHYAASEGHIDICCDLIKYGADVNGLDSYNRTPLHRAAENGHCGVIELLVNSGAKPCVEDDLGNTPLLLACYFSQLQAAKGLLNLCSNVNHSDIEGNSPLHVLCSPCRRNSESFTKSTYKHVTTRRDIFQRAQVFHVDEKLVDILISYGAFVEAVNKSGSSPFDCAKHYLNPDSQLVLLEKFVNAGLWVANFPPETAFGPSFTYHVKESRAEFEEMLSHLQKHQMKLKQQCKSAIRKNINFSGGKNVQYYVGYLPLPTQLKVFLQ